MNKLIQSLVQSRRAHKLAAVALISLAAIGTAGAIVGDGAALAAGSGHRTVPGGQRTFTFNVVEHQDGTFSGQAQLHTYAEDEFGELQPVLLHIQLDDAVVLGPGMALITGYLTKIKGPVGDPVGSSIGFVVLDNDQDGGDQVDELTNVFGWSDEPFPGLAHFLVDIGAASFLVGLLAPIETGNLHVF